ncbi:D-aminoacylase [Quadrisphaera sp. INWT6]|uniref:N-acyl-D-amino-acid deacylase family protein n=1 Tax=Quadrisphaera sp. INWT6 TaxID=2596917 RepID=UPI001D2F1070|nr:D-aminoacylase [Quadrisphaera sp. INWT6]MBF5080266.1 D-aminoacylase [Quadrisphaera sp. INWT6]
MTPSGGAGSGESRDLLVRGALLVDGTGAPGHRGDALVSGGVLRALGDVPRHAVPAGARVLDADGLVLCPGFVDLHAHSDVAVLTDPAHLSRALQGVTTEVLGQDGLSYAPVDDAALAVLDAQLAGWNGRLPAGLVTWRDVGGYLDRIDAGTAVNACYLVPQGTVRLLVVGVEDRPATPAEVAAMRALVRAGMAQGAVGMSSGLTYTPGMHASADELAALCEEVAAAGGYWAPHTRSYGAGALEAYAEALEVGRRSGAAVHLTHATMNFPVNRGRAGELLALVDAAVAAGQDVTLDSYPYLPGSTTLAALLPSWAAAGGPEALLARLSQPHDGEELARLRHDLEVRGADGCHGVPVDWASVQVSGVATADDPWLAAAVGSTVAELAQREGRAPFAVAVDLLVRDRLGTTVLQHVGDAANVREVVASRHHSVGSDGLLVGARPHPRAWGAFAHLLGPCVREGLLTVEEAVARMTLRPARRLGLAGPGPGARGVLRVGAVADLVLFDPETVEGATFDEPRRPPCGVPHVWVAGVPLVSDGRRTGATPGRSLRPLLPSPP